jgi:hypothetical protein
LFIASSSGAARPGGLLGFSSKCWMMTRFSLFHQNQDTTIDDSRWSFKKLSGKTHLLFGKLLNPSRRLGFLNGILQRLCANSNRRPASKEPNPTLTFPEPLLRKAKEKRVFATSLSRKLARTGRLPIRFFGS